MRDTVPMFLEATPSVRKPLVLKSSKCCWIRSSPGGQCRRFFPPVISTDRQTSEHIRERAFGYHQVRALVEYKDAQSLAQEIIGESRPPLGSLTRQTDDSPDGFIDRIVNPVSYSALR